MEKSNREYRNMTMEIREAVEGEEEQKKIVNGYASTFDEPYLLFSDEGFEYWEVVDRSAFDETDMSDVIMQYDHRGRVFARTRNNTLTVEPDDKGLFIEADLGGTEIGCELYEEISGGYTDSYRRERRKRKERRRYLDIHEAHHEGGQALRCFSGFNSSQ